MGRITSIARLSVETVRLHASVHSSGLCGFVTRKRKGIKTKFAVSVSQDKIISEMSFAIWRHFITAHGSYCGYSRAIVNFEQGLTILSLLLRGSEVYKLVKNGQGGSVAFRPTLINPTLGEAEEYGDGCSSEELVNTVKRCWSEDPAERPDFHALKTIIKRINKYATTDLVDYRTNTCLRLKIESELYWTRSSTVKIPLVPVVEVASWPAAVVFLRR